MSQSSLALVWFRQDLRLADNPALLAAVRRGYVLPIYILDDDNAGQWAMGAASRAWLHRSLESLNRSLDGGLRLFRGNAENVIASLTSALPIDGVYWNRCYEPWRNRRDTHIKKVLREAGVDAQSFNGSLLWEPWQVSKANGDPYRVFTPYYQKGCLSQDPPREPLAQPSRISLYHGQVGDSLDLEACGLLPREDWHSSVLGHWQVGEQQAHRRLENFCQHLLGAYREGRDFPAIDATSRLSPHLHFGEVSPHQAWHYVERTRIHGSGEGVSHFQRELAWREFSHYLLYHFPELPEKNFNPRFDAFEWIRDDEAVVAWQRGLTGFPIVDAGMRELWQTGYMHNRVRMIVASFLIKNLLCDWRSGAAWFWDCLVDADLANNSASWQWCAGSGADAAPYFRIFNPERQSEKFDPDGIYLARYCPELAGLPPALRHRPGAASLEELEQAGLRLGLDYPLPLVDLKTTRERALERYRALP